MIFSDHVAVAAPI